jgi:hypothetical protein
LHGGKCDGNEFLDKTENLLLIIEEETKEHFPGGCLYHAAISRGYAPVLSVHMNIHTAGDRRRLPESPERSGTVPHDTRGKQSFGRSPLSNSKTTDQIIPFWPKLYAYWKPTTPKASSASQIDIVMFLNVVQVYSFLYRPQHRPICYDIATYT